MILAWACPFKEWIALGSQEQIDLQQKCLEIAHFDVHYFK